MQQSASSKKKKNLSAKLFTSEKYFLAGVGKKTRV